jgi:sec-independent protein translocase protein TatA
VQFLLPAAWWFLNLCGEAKKNNMVHTFVLFLNLGGGEIILILFVILMMFGGKGIPSIARTLGKGIREFKDATNDIQRDIQKSTGNITDQVEEHIQEIKKEIEEE